MHIHSPHQAIDTAVDINIVDLKDKETVILSEITSLTKGRFKPGELLWRSDYYGTGKLGAFHYKGMLDNRQVVVKIQGAKPQVSEVEMIRKFSVQNKSEMVRPPSVLEFFPWSSDRGYEVIFFEYVPGIKIIESGKLVTSNDVKSFFSVYREYRQNSVNTPWLDKPEINFDKDFAMGLAFSQKIRPKSKLRHSDDIKLAQKAGKILKAVWRNASLEFQHGHFSVEDLVVNSDLNGKKEIILFSNLFWKWKYPFYDAVFAYHWFMYSLSSVKNIQPQDINEQRDIWLDEIRKIAEERKDVPDSFIKAALLERAVAGLLVDGVAYADEDDIVSVYLMESTRKEVKRLAGELGVSGDCI